MNFIYERKQVISAQELIDCLKVGYCIELLYIEFSYNEKENFYNLLINEEYSQLNTFLYACGCIGLFNEDRLEVKKGLDLLLELAINKYVPAAAKLISLVFSDINENFHEIFYPEMEKWIDEDQEGLANKIEEFIEWLKSIDYHPIYYLEGMAFSNGLAGDSGSGLALLSFEKALSYGINTVFEISLLLSKFADIHPSDKDKIFNLLKKEEENGYQNITKLFKMNLHLFSRYKNVVEYFFEYFKKAASNGNADASYEVAIYYDVFLKNKEEGIRWYLQAANNGNSVAQCHLGVFYSSETYKEEITEDELKGLVEKAIYWYEKACSNGNEDAMTELGHFYQLGNIKAYADDTLYDWRDPVKGIYWFEKAATLGYKRAQEILGHRYYKGYSVDKNIEKAIYWLERAVKQNSEIAMCELAEIYVNEFEIPNYQEAIKLYLKAAQNHNNQAFYHLGVFYLNGLGVKKDTKQAIIFFNKVLEYFDEISFYPTYENWYYASLYQLGMCYYFGLDVDVDYEKAFDYFERSAKGNYVLSMVYLAKCLKEGYGTKVDYYEAKKWALVARDNGYEVDELINEIDLLIDSLEENKIISFGDLNFKENKDVFISWNHNDKKIKDYLVARLNELGINSCFDSDGDCHGELVPVIKKAISSCKASIILVTENSIKSEWVKQEVKEMLKKAELNPIYLECIKPVFISSDIDVIELIKEIDDETNPFKKLLNLGGQFENYNTELNIENIYKFILQSLDKVYKFQYKEKIAQQFQTFSATLKTGYSTFNTKTGIISTMIDYKDGYIERKLYVGENANSTQKIFEYENPVLIYGEGGSGKSLLLKNVIRCSHNYANFIFLIECKKTVEYLKRGYDFLNILKTLSFDNYFEDSNYKLSPSSFEEIFTSSEDVYIFVDALDEMSLEYKKILFDIISKFNLKYHKVHFIFTSRDCEDSIMISNAFNNSCDTFELRGLTDEEMEALYNRIIDKVKNILVKDIYENKNDFNDFKMKLYQINDEIKRNPLLLSNLIYIYLLSNDFPKTKYELINKTVKIMIDDIEEERNVMFKYKEFLNKENLTKLLSTLAILRANGDTTPIVDIFNEIIIEIDSTLDSYNMALSIFKHLKARRIIDENTLSHEIFKDYFAAVSIYEVIYEIKKDLFKRKLVYKENGYEILRSLNDNFLSQENNWPRISNDFITMLDFKVKELNDNKENIAFSKTIDFLVKEKNISSTALEILKQLIERKSLYFYEYIKSKL